MASILVVDDNPSIRRSLRRLFESNGYTVAEAPTGRMALTNLRHAPSDLVVSDVFMPDMNGYELLMTLRDEFPDIPLIMMSGGDGGVGKTNVLHAGSKLGALRVFEKPFRLNEMLEAVQGALAD
jgi:CheY-like chemotaxis protein